MRKVFLFLLAVGLSAQEPSLGFQVKFLKILMSATSQYGIACRDTAVKSRLESVGVNIAPTWKLAYATSEEDVKAYRKAGKLVFVNNPAWLDSGAAIAATEVDGKPQIRLNAANVKASGLALSDTLIRMSTN